MRNTTGLLCLLFAAMALTTHVVHAQTVIGGVSPDPLRALHIIKTGSMTDPLRLSGLRESTTLDQVLVVDPTTGVPMYRDAASLTTSGEWSYDPSMQGIYATRAALGDGIGGSGTDFVITDSGRMGIGMNPTVGSVRLAIRGTTRVDGSNRLEFRDATNAIYSSGSNNNWYFAGQSYVSFRNRPNNADIFVVQANSERVGIKVRDPDVDFEVNGTQRMSGANRLEFGSAMNQMYAQDVNNLRIAAQTQTNFMNRAENAVVMSVDANTTEVGIGTTDPRSKLHVFMEGDQNNAFASNSFRVGGNVNYVALDENELQAYNAAGARTADLHLQADGGRVIVGNSDQDDSTLWAVGDAHFATGAAARRVGIGTVGPQAKLHVAGNTRIEGLADVTADAFIVTANAAGDLRQVTPDELADFAGDDLGNHEAEENIQLKGFWLSNDGGNEGVRVDNNGLVGIGKAPNRQLDVAGELEIDFRMWIEGKQALKGNGSFLELNSNGDFTSGTYNKFDFRVDGASEFNGDGLATGFFRAESDNNSAMLFVDAADDRVGIGTIDPQQVLDVNGRARVRTLPTIANDTYVVTADNNGNLSRRVATDLASVHWTQNGAGEIYNTTLNNVGINNTNPLVAFDVGGTALIRDRLWMGSTDTRFIGDPLPAGVNAGMHPTDGAIWVPTHTGSQSSNLRLYVPNDADDQFSIWGNNCSNGDCGDLFASTRVVSFRGDGIVEFDNRVGINVTPEAGKVLHTDGQIRFEDVDQAPNSGRNYWILLVDADGNLYRSRNQANGNVNFTDPEPPVRNARVQRDVSSAPRLGGITTTPAAQQVEQLQQALEVAEAERDALEDRLARLEELLLASSRRP